MASSRVQCQCFWLCSIMRSVIQLRERMASNFSSSSIFLTEPGAAAQWILGAAAVVVAAAAGAGSVVSTVAFILVSLVRSGMECHPL